MKRIILMLVLVLFLSSKMIFAAPVEDNSGILSQSQISALTDQIRAVESKHGIRIGIQIFDSVPGSISATADRILDQNYIGQNGSILLLMSMNSRDWYISTDSQMMNIVSNTDGINYLSKNFLPYMSGGDYYSAFSTYIDGVDKLLDYYEANDSAYTDDGGFDPLAAGFSGIMSIMLGGMYRSSLKNSMSNVRPASGASSYLNRNSVKIVENFDSFLFRNVTRRTKAQSSNHGSGGSSNSHGGGGGSF